MYIGIIAEGKSDLSVIKNILKGKLNIDSSDLQYLQPDMEYDETDLYNMQSKNFSNWELVKNTCIEKKRLSDFFSIEENRYIIIQIDTAEAEEKNYEVMRPVKHNNPNYSAELRKNVVSKINEWLDNQFQGQIFYAIAIEEIEAWVMTIYSNMKTDTARYSDPKIELNKILNRKMSKKEKKLLSIGNELIKFDKLSKKFKNRKNLNTYMRLNKSLEIFCKSLEELK